MQKYILIAACWITTHSHATHLSPNAKPTTRTTMEALTDSECMDKEVYAQIPEIRDEQESKIAHDEQLKKLAYIIHVHRPIPEQISAERTFDESKKPDAEQPKKLAFVIHPSQPITALIGEYKINEYLMRVETNRILVFFLDPDA